MIRALKEFCYFGLPLFLVVVDGERTDAVDLYAGCKKTGVRGLGVVALFRDGPNGGM